MIKEMRRLQISLSTCERHGSSYGPVADHFSHPHPLHLEFTQQQQEKISGPCQACKLQASGWIYKCDPCGYILHASCSQMPQIINHPTDLKHPLSLLPRPTYPSGSFVCNACGGTGNGFCYHCDLCSVDIHIQCVSIPLSLANSAHRHPLALTFSPVSNTSLCTCNICQGRVDSRFWRYRCNECDFDAHLYCARGKAEVAVQKMEEGIQQQGEQAKMGTRESVKRNDSNGSNFEPGAGLGGGQGTHWGCGSGGGQGYHREHLTEHDGWMRFLGSGLLFIPVVIQGHPQMVTSSVAHFNSCKYCSK